MSNNFSPDVPEHRSLPGQDPVGWGQYVHARQPIIYPDGQQYFYSSLPKVYDKAPMEMPRQDNYNFVGQDGNQFPISVGASPLLPQGPTSQRRFFVSPESLSPYAPAVQFWTDQPNQSQLTDHTTTINRINIPPRTQQDQSLELDDWYPSIVTPPFVPQRVLPAMRTHAAYGSSGSHQPTHSSSLYSGSPQGLAKLYDYSISSKTPGSRQNYLPPQDLSADNFSSDQFNSTNPSRNSSRFSIDFSHNMTRSPQNQAPPGYDSVYLSNSPLYGSLDGSLPSYRSPGNWSRSPQSANVTPSTSPIIIPQRQLDRSPGPYLPTASNLSFVSTPSQISPRYHPGSDNSSVLTADLDFNLMTPDWHLLDITDPTPPLYRNRPITRSSPKAKKRIQF